MFYALIVIAIIMVCIEVYAGGKNRDRYLKGKGTGYWNIAYRWRWALGIPFAVLPAFISYPIASSAQTYQIIGFPLAVAAINESGGNHVGQFTTPFFAINAAIWYFFPQVLLWLWKRG